MKQVNVYEKSIIKKFRKEIWSKFIKGINEYQLISENDKIAVCISGGKDSMLLAKCMQELKRHGQINFDLEFIVMDPGYSDYNMEVIINNAKLLNIPITIFKTEIFKIVTNHGMNEPCYLCARMRRGYLYAKAKELGCNKIALGHHFDDVIETIMLNILYNGTHQTMMPKLHSQNFEGLELIRPLYLVNEEHIMKWRDYNNLKFINCECMITKKDNLGKRNEVKELIKSLKEINPDIAKNIFKSSMNVNLSSLLGYKENKDIYSFLDNYSKK